MFEISHKHFEDFSHSKIIFFELCRIVFSYETKLGVSNSAPHNLSICYIWEKIHLTVFEISSHANFKKRACSKTNFIKPPKLRKATGHHKIYLNGTFGEITLNTKTLKILVIKKIFLLETQNGNSTL